MKILYEDLEKTFQAFKKFDKKILSKNFKKTEKIFIKDSPRISKRFLLKVFERSQ